MLNRVPEAARIANRAMVTRHPNAMVCQVWRKSVTRTLGAGATLVGGLPTLGGLAVLDQEDEAEVEYTLIGTGKVLFAGVYEGTTLNDSRDAAEGMATALASIEPDVAGAFEPKDSDLIMAEPGGGIVIPYEVTRVINAVNIPPYVPKYELSAQGDLMSPPGLAALQAARP